jgi:hypothetical protein
MTFERVPVDGSQKMDDSFMEAIEPYDYSRLIPFTTACLSGFLADRYDVDAEQSKPRAEQRIRNSTEAMLRGTVSGYATVTPVSSRFSVQNGKIQYALMPVWLLNTRYKDKLYTFAMNGQTGKFVGEYPISTGRFWAWVGGIAGILTALFTLIGYFFL